MPDNTVYFSANDTLDTTLTYTNIIVYVDHRNIAMLQELTNCYTEKVYVCVSSDIDEQAFNAIKSMYNVQQLVFELDTKLNIFVCRIR